MSKSTDWLPRTRDARLAVARSWFLKLQIQAAQWNIPGSFVQDLTAKANAADNLLAQDKSAERARRPLAHSAKRLLTPLWRQCAT
jgi:hypothetical protein